MQFELDDDRALLRSSTRELLEAEADLAESRGLMEDSAEGYSKAFHAQLAELGYLGLLLTEEEGGAGMGAVGLAAVLAEMGRVALPGPFLEAVQAVELLRRCEDDVARSWCQRIVAGEGLVVLAEREATEGAAHGAPETTFGDGRVRGSKTFVPFGAQADALLVTTRDGVVLVERPDAGFEATALPTLDHAQRFAAIALDGPGLRLAGDTASALDAARQVGTLGAAAQLFGLMERALELTLAYTAEREAFGAPIASFQALQHRAADMLLKTESSRAAVFRAAWAVDAGLPEAAYLVAVAKAWAGDAARLVCGEAIQMHGGVGFTWEYDPHVFYKRVKTLEAFHGSTREQVERALELAPQA